MTGQGPILAVNAGSSSLKIRLVGSDHALLDAVDLPAEHGKFEASDAAAAMARFSGQATAIGHRIVHGGPLFNHAVRLDDEVERRLWELADLAPLHQPAGLAGVAAAAAALPALPGVACFDTAFHAGLPPAAATYAVPEHWRRRHALRRYGFHGLSHAYASRRAARMLQAGPAGLRMVTCHLGAGASLAAVAGGSSVDTTMGFTPLDGLVMSTRCGSLDPGLVLWLQTHAQMSAADLTEDLEQHSGLFALAGTGDMRVVLKRSSAGDADALLALAVYLHRLRAAIASMTAAMGGLDAIVFTGGVGEHAPEVRAGAVEGLGYLGVELDAERNASAQGDTTIGVDGAPVALLRIEAREDLQIAAEVRTALGWQGSLPGSDG